MRKMASWLILMLTVSHFGLDAQCLFINEVYTRPAATGTNGNPCDTGEWIELYNSSAAMMDIGCYTICTFESQSGTDRGHCVTLPSGTMIAAGGYYLIGGNGSICPTCDFTSGSLGLNWHSYTCASNMTIGVNQSCGTCGVLNRLQFLGVLHDGGEDLSMYDASGALVDAVTFGSRGNRATFTTLNMPAAGGCSGRVLTIPASSNVAYEFMGPAGGAGSGFERTLDGGNTWASTTTATSTPGSSNGSSLGCTPLSSAITDFVASGSGNDVQLSWEIPLEIDPQILHLEVSDDATDFRLLQTWTSPAHMGAYVHPQGEGEAWYRLIALGNDGETLASATLRHTVGSQLALAQVVWIDRYLVVTPPIDSDLRVMDLGGRVFVGARCEAQVATKIGVEGWAPGFYLVDLVNGDHAYRSIHKVVLGGR